jgi:hypothetical protein
VLYSLYCTWQCEITQAPCSEVAVPSTYLRSADSRAGTVGPDGHDCHPCTEEKGGIIQGGVPASRRLGSGSPVLYSVQCT